MKTVWLIYEMRKGYDVVVDAAVNEALADAIVKNLDKRHPRSDGFYTQAQDVRTSL